jgi:hypothetical protein
MCLCVSQTQPVISSTSVSWDHCFPVSWQHGVLFLALCLLVLVFGVGWHKLRTSGDVVSGDTNCVLVETVHRLWSSGADVANRVSRRPPVATVLFQMDLRVKGRTVGHYRSENIRRWHASIIFDVFTEIVDSLVTLRVVWVCACVRARFIFKQFYNIFRQSLRTLLLCT